MKNIVQVIGIDIGRKNTKIYSEFNGVVYQELFSSVIGDGRSTVDTSKYKDPIYINVEGVDYFVGDLAEKDSYSVTRNSSDSKTSLTVRILISASLSKVAQSPNVKLMIGVPNNGYRKSNLMDILNTYKGKTITVKDNITNTMKAITIEDVDIYREADSVAIEVLQGGVNNVNTAFVSVGMKTCEIGYYEKGFNYIDRYSTSIFYANQNILRYIQDRLKADGVVVDLVDIDSNKGDYDDLKANAYELASETLTQKLEEVIPNASEVEFYIVGGTAEYLNLDPRFKTVEEPIMTVAKGLFRVGQMVL